MSLFLLGSGLATIAPWFPGLMALAGGILVVKYIFSRRYGAVIILIAGALLVLLRPPAPLPAPGAFGYGASSLVGFYISPPTEISGGYAQRFQVMKGTGGRLKEISLLSGRAFPVGESRAINARIIVPRKHLNPGARPQEPFAYMEEAGTAGALIMTPQVAVNRLRAKLNREISRLFGPGEAALVAAVTTGGRLAGARDIRGDFRDAGLAHLFSISGTHFGFFALMLFGLFRLLLTRLPRLWLERITESITLSEAAALLVFPFMLGYLFLSGARVPSIRAFVMTGMFLAGLLLGRRGGWMPFLGLAAFAIIIFDPQALSGLSFQMSFLAVLFIGMVVWGGDVTPPPYEELSGWQSMLLYLRGLVLITLAATLGVFPLVAYFFHYFSLISPVANFLVAPLISMALVPLSLIGALSYLLTGTYITWPLVALVAKASIWLAQVFSSVPMASVHVPDFPVVFLLVYYAGFALWFWKRYMQVFLLIPALSVAACMFFLVFAFPVHSGDSMRVTFPDAGRSDAAVVELPAGGGTLVVDTGRSAREVTSFLRARGIRSIDALILTHGHADHAGGLGRLVREFEVREIWDGGWVEYPSHIEGAEFEGIPRRSLARGDVVEGQGFKLLALHPYEGYQTPEDKHRGVNDRSLVFRLTGGGVSFMFSGDIGADAARNIRHIPPEWLKADVLKAPHHGRNYEALVTMLKATGAGLLVATDTSEKRATRGVMKTRPRLEVHITGRDGAVSYVARGGELGASLYADTVMVKWPSLKQEGENILKLFSTWP